MQDREALRCRPIRQDQAETNNQGELKGKSYHARIHKGFRIGAILVLLASWLCSGV